MKTERAKDSMFVCTMPNPRADVRLFCFPYAGGSSLIYKSWPNGLPAFVEVWSVQPPGRGHLFSEAPFTRLQSLVEAIAETISRYLDRDFVFFGHSMGSKICFELARHLRRHACLSPARLLVSGCRAPQLPGRADPSIHDLPENEFMDELRRLKGTPKEALENQALMKLMIPVLRADFAVCGTYEYVDEPPLQCPISAFGGLQDHDVSRDDLEAWRVQTKADFSLRMFPGDHFFLNTYRELVLKAVTDELIEVNGGSARRRAL